MSRAKKKGDDKGEREAKMKAHYDEIISKGLEDPKVSSDKTGYAFTTLILPEQNLEGLHTTFATYKELTHVDLSLNNITDFSVLGQLPNLTRLILHKNNIREIKCLANEELFLNL